MVNQTHRLRSAFTLVEMSLVLVIIGLIIGGVVAGQDLIRAATIRTVVTDLEKYNTASTTFRSKYGGLPGDLKHERAIEFNFSTAGDTNANGANGLRDGNGVVQSPVANSLEGEIALFWQDLGKSGFIGGSYTATGTTTGTGASITPATLNQFLPRTRLRENVAHVLYSDIGRHYYYLAAFTTDAASLITPANAVKPLEAKDIDEKVDDGAPTTGSVISMTDLTTPNPGAIAAPTVCNTNATPSVYNVSTAATGAADAQVCQIRVRSSF